MQSPEARLCLRAHGQLSLLLLRLGECDEGRRLRMGVGPRWMAMALPELQGCWHSLSLDPFAAGELLEGWVGCTGAHGV